MSAERPAGATYVYASLDDLARTFDARADIEERNARSEAIGAAFHRHKGAAAAYRLCAEILRATEIKP